MKSLKTVGLLFSLSLMLITGACNRAKDNQHFGKDYDKSAPKVTLAKLIAEPETYNGKNVIVDGHFAGNCGDGDFYFKDKFDIIEAEPPVPDVCLLSNGTPLRLYGLVKARHSEGSEALVRIVAKGVEVVKP